jgi:hypothetical protein
MKVDLDDLGDTSICLRDEQRRADLPYGIGRAQIDSLIPWTGPHRVTRFHQEQTPPPCLRSLKRESNAQEQSRLFHIVVLVAEDANTAWLHHQAERERQVIAQPPLSECPGCVAMRDQDDILRLVVVHVRCLDLANLLDQHIETRSEFGGRPGGLSVGVSKI